MKLTNSLSIFTNAWLSFIKCSLFLFYNSLNVTFKTQFHIKKLFFTSRFAQFPHVLSFDFIQAVKRNSVHIEYQQEKKTGSKITVKRGFCSRPSSAVCP